MQESAESEFVSHLDDVLKATTERLKRAGEVIGITAESRAKQYITEQKAVDTGNLRNSITHRVEEDDDSVSVIIGSAVEYAPYIELGTGKYAEGGKGRQTPWRYKDNKGKWHTTSGQPPRPFLRPAIENHREQYKRIIAEEVGK